MEIELKEIRDFIAAIPPFDRLPQEKLDELTRRLSIEYVRRGRTVPSDPDAPPGHAHAGTEPVQPAAQLYR